jgi:hypothetical protein
VALPSCSFWGTSCILCLMLGQVCLRSGLRNQGHGGSCGSPLSAHHRRHLRPSTASAGTANAAIEPSSACDFAFGISPGREGSDQGGFAVRQKTLRLCFRGCAHVRSRVIQGRDLSTHSRGRIRACGCPRCQSGVEMDASNATFRFL